MLLRRLRNLRNAREAQKLAEEFLKNPQMAERLRETLRQSGGKTSLPDGMDSDGKLRDLIKRLVQDGNVPLSGDGGRPNQESLEKLKELIKQQADRSKAGDGSDSSNQPNREGSEGDRRRESNDGRPGPDGSSRQSGESGSGTREGAQGSPLSRQFARKLTDMAEKFQDSHSSLGDSPTLQRALRSLNRVGGDGDRWGDFGKNGDRIASSLPDLGRFVRLDKLRPEGGLSLFKNRDWLPSMSGFRWPGGSLPSVKLGGFSGGPSFGPPSISPGGASSSGTGMVLVWVIALAALGLAAWKILGSAKKRITSAPSSGWRLGRWPVQPAAIRTREDLIKAFDYLSLLQLGQAARHWNHRQIAVGLGSKQDEERDRAATHLAGVYEQARYAPISDDLPDAELAAARRHLCQLAGVSAL